MDFNLNGSNNELILSSLFILNSFHKRIFFKIIQTHHLSVQWCMFADRLLFLFLPHMLFFLSLGNTINCVLCMDTSSRILHWEHRACLLVFVHPPYIRSLMLILLYLVPGFLFFHCFASLSLYFYGRLMVTPSCSFCQAKCPLHISSKPFT